MSTPWKFCCQMPGCVWFITPLRVTPEHETDREITRHYQQEHKVIDMHEALRVANGQRNEAWDSERALKAELDRLRVQAGGAE